MRTLYPDITPYQTGTLQVDDRHALYWEQCGNPDGKPVVMLHGGPGAGCGEKMRRFHDPAKYRIVLFDQRGCGPQHAARRPDRQHDLGPRCRHRNASGACSASNAGRCSAEAGVRRCALAYAETHPQRVTELVLRGIFMLRRWELEWFYQEGASRLFPEAWAPYAALIPEAERGDMIAAYHQRLTSDDEAVRLAAAQAWATWEGATSYLHIDPNYLSSHGDAHFALAFARIENHYFTHKGFFDADDQLLRDVHRIADIPGIIVHGRYDVVCPVQSAFDLHKAWPKARLAISAASGHSAFEAENVDALVRATDFFANARSST